MIERVDSESLQISHRAGKRQLNMLLIGWIAERIAIQID